MPRDECRRQDIESVGHLWVQETCSWNEKYANLIQKFRNGLEKILGNGTYQRIIEEYYGKDLVLEDIVPEYLHDKIERVRRNTP